MTHKVFATLVLLLASGAVFAQSTISGFITRTVLDPSRAVIRGAAVTLQDPATSKMLTASTNNVGVFHFDYVPSGTYALSVSATGLTHSEKR